MLLLYSFFKLHPAPPEHIGTACLNRLCGIKKKCNDIKYGTDVPKLQLLLLRKPFGQRPSGCKSLTLQKSRAKASLTYHTTSIIVTVFLHFVKRIPEILFRFSQRIFYRGIPDRMHRLFVASPDTDERPPRTILTSKSTCRAP